MVVLHDAAVLADAALRLFTAATVDQVTSEPTIVPLFEFPEESVKVVPDPLEKL